MLRLLHKEADEVFAEHSQEIRPKDKELLGYLTATRESRSLGAVLREKRKRESVANSVVPHCANAGDISVDPNFSDGQVLILGKA